MCKIIEFRYFWLLHCSATNKLKVGQKFVYHPPKSFSFLDIGNGQLEVDRPVVRQVTHSAYQNVFNDLSWIFTGKVKPRSCVIVCLFFIKNILSSIGIVQSPNVYKIAKVHCYYWKLSRIWIVYMELTGSIKLWIKSYVVVSHYKFM